MSDIADKVRKLLDTAERFEKDGNAEAAASYNEKAQRLILDYAVDEAMLQAAGKGKAEGIVQQSFEFKNSYAGGWAAMGYFIAEGLGLRAFITEWRPGHQSVTVIGFKSDLETFDVLFASLQLQEKFAVVTDWKEHSAIYTYDKNIVRFKQSHMRGFGSTIKNRLIALRREVVAEKGHGAELVLVSKKDKIDRYMDDNFGKFKTSRTRSSTGYGAGSAAGNRADIGQGRVSNRGRAALV